MIRPGEEWGHPSHAVPDLEVVGGDLELASVVAQRPGVLVRFRPDAGSDLAGAVGLRNDLALQGNDLARGIEVSLDLLRLRDVDPPLDVPSVNMPVVNMPAVNMIVIGSPPDTAGRFVRRFAANVRVDDKPVFHGPCTTVVIATGQFRRGLDVIPRGHPGDGRAEVQIYAVPGRERRQLRARLATGTHVPHPHITQRSGARVVVSIDRRVPIEVDGRPLGRVDHVGVDVVPNAYRLLL